MPQPDHTPEPLLEQNTFVDLLMERLRVAARATFETVMEEELTAYLSALPYQRSQERQGQRNGYYSRCLGTGFGVVELDVPRSRDGTYHTQVFERYQHGRGYGWLSPPHRCS